MSDPRARTSAGPMPDDRGASGRPPAERVMTAYVRAYVACGRTAHLVDGDGRALCHTRPRAGRRWLGTRTLRERERLAGLSPCRCCAVQEELLRQLAEWDGPPPRPGVLAFAAIGRSDRRAVAECADCGRLRWIASRGLCSGCQRRHMDEGTLREWGWVRADRLAEYAALRARGVTIAAAAVRVGVCRRTAERYERDLRHADAAA